MTKNEYEAIICLIDIDVENNDLKQLKDLKKYINKKINDYKKNLCVENKDIIFEKLDGFIDNNFFGIEKTELRIDLLKQSIREIKGIEDIYVGDLIDININDITLSKYYCGEQTINKINDVLKKYGFSIYEELDEKQIDKLECIRYKRLELK